MLCYKVCFFYRPPFMVHVENSLVPSYFVSVPERSVELNTKTRNNWNRYLMDISGRILLKPLDYSLSFSVKRWLIRLLGSLTITS